MTTLNRSSIVTLSCCWNTLSSRCPIVSVVCITRHCSTTNQGVACFARCQSALRMSTLNGRGAEARQPEWLATRTQMVAARIEECCVQRWVLAPQGAEWQLDVATSDHRGMLAQRDWRPQQQQRGRIQNLTAPPTLLGGSPHVLALLAPTALRLLGGVNVMHRAVVGRHSALDAFQAHCSSAVTLLAICCALLVCPPGSSRRAEPAACFTHGTCTLLGLDGFQLFPRVPSGAFRALAVVLNPWCSTVLGIPAFACCVPGGVYGM